MTISFLPCHPCQVSNTPSPEFKTAQALIGQKRYIPVAEWEEREAGLQQGTQKICFASWELLFPAEKIKDAFILAGNSIF